MNKKTLVAVGIVIALVLAGAILAYRDSKKPGQYDALAACLKEKGTIFYGAFWCPNCQTQKKMFGRSAKILPYVECSTPDGKKQLQICQDNNIERYPTWEFSGGERLEGVVPLETLAEKTNCELPS